MIVPDVAFQLGPFAPIRKHPKKLVDVLVFLRAHLESKVKSIRNEEYIKSVFSAWILRIRIMVQTRSPFVLSIGRIDWTFLEPTISS